MVTRKPVPKASGSDTSAPPYPVSPVRTEAPPSLLDSDPPYPLETNVSKRSTHDNPSASQAHGASQEIPESLRVGPPGRSPQPAMKSNNPFLRRQTAAQNEQSSSSASGDSVNPEAPSNPPPPPPIPKISHTPPTGEFGGLSISEHQTNPWHNAEKQEPLPEHRPTTVDHKESSSAQEWFEAPSPTHAPPPPPPPLKTDEPDAGEDEPGSPAWDEGEFPQELPAGTPHQAVPSSPEESGHWGENDAAQNKHDVSVAAERVAQEEHINQNGAGCAAAQIDPQQSRTAEQENGIAEQENGVTEPVSLIDLDDAAPTIPPPVNEPQPPPLPPRRSVEEAPPQPPRPVANTIHQSTDSPATAGTESPATQNQKKETYEIKKISWHDATSPFNPRISPILVQNANGPCPLLALVNALVLDTPPGLNTALVETLRTREQVSLGLLLDAVFDELMSGRRRDSKAEELPDVGELYSFLVTLHTGMNVNPRFFPDKSDESVAESIGAMPGCFESTRELRLYGTFDVSLIHGWLPTPNTPAYAALRRSAETYEDAQNLLFVEEELKNKLSSAGLSFREQGLLEDAGTIKWFLFSAATQLTSYGLEVIVKNMRRGSIAILFRNDHFSTIYRHPTSNQLLQLVTDFGYAGHEEVVWESLADVNGENCEFLSGDFKVVGGAQDASTTPPDAAADGWTTVAPRRHQNPRVQNIQQAQVSGTVDNGSRTGRVSHSSSTLVEEPVTSASHTAEQEDHDLDHDLALALQLQEEEEERHREEVSRRRREQELSQQFIEQQGIANNNSSTNSPPRPRGTSHSRHTSNNSNIAARGRLSHSSPRPNYIRLSNNGNLEEVPVRPDVVNATAEGNITRVQDWRGNIRADSIRVTPVRRSNRSTGGSSENQTRPTVPPRNANTTHRPVDPEAGVEAPPPSYEHAAAQAAYVPPPDHPSHPSASPNLSLQNTRTADSNGHQRTASPAYTPSSTAFGRNQNPAAAANAAAIGLGGSGGSRNRRTGSVVEVVQDAQRRGKQKSTSGASNSNGESCVVM